MLSTQVTAKPNKAPTKLNKVNRKLKEAVMNREADEVKRLISEEKANVNAIDASGYHAFDWLQEPLEDEDDDYDAATQDEIACILLDRGFDALKENKDQEYPLEFILRYSWRDAFGKFLTKYTTQHRLDDFRLKYRGDRVPFITYVIAYGDMTLFEKAADAFETDNYKKQMRIENIRSLLIEDDQDPPYEYALCLLELDFMKVQLTDDDDQFYFLRKFIESNDIDYVKRFAAICDYDVTTTDEAGDTCLHHAIITTNDIKIIERFTDEKIIDKKNNAGNTPLLLALTELIDLQKEVGMGDLSGGREIAGDVSDITDGDDRKKYRTLVKTINRLLAAGVSVRMRDDDHKNDDHKDALSLSKKLHSSEHSLAYTISEHAKIEMISAEIGKHSSVLDEKQKDAIKKYTQKKYRDNASRDEVEMKEEYDAVVAIQKTIAEKPYVQFEELNIYELIERLKEKNLEYKLKCFARYKEKTPLSADSYYYTFLDNKVYRLTRKNNAVKSEDVPQHIAYQLMTTLTYERNRHVWTDRICQLHHKLLTKLNPQYKTFTTKKYEKTITAAEEKNGDYYGENLSDNSDSDEEEKFQSLPNRKKILSTSAITPLLARAQTENLMTQKRELKKSLPVYDRGLRQKIIHSAPLPDQAHRDLENLNILAIKGGLDEKTIKTIGTRFFVAQYRGVCYRTDEWNRMSRQQHRSIREEKLPQYSRAVLAESGSTTFHDHFKKMQAASSNQIPSAFHRHFNIAQANPSHQFHEKLIAISTHLQDQLFQLRNSGPVKLKLMGGTEYLFDNALHALQDLYTKDYERFHETLGGFVKAFTHPELDEKGEAVTTVNSLDNLKHAILLSINNEFNFFVSTADTPDQALKYAYGKAYNNYKEFRLRPRWRKTGLVERPYSGKTYISLHDPLELFARTHHLVSMNREGKVRIDLQTINERETSFMAYIPPNKVIGQHIAKFPSFEGEYKEIYFEKYGLTKELYEKFKNELLKHAPHTKERRHIVQLLTEHLISYYEVCLIEEARVTAEKLGGVLIYRNDQGGFSLFPCLPKEISRSNDAARNTAAQAVTEEIQERRKARQEAAAPSSGFFTHQLNQYQIVPSFKQDTLIESLVMLLKVPENELKELEEKTKPAQHNPTLFAAVGNSFRHHFIFLDAVANKYKKNIVIHGSQFNAGKLLIKPKAITLDQEDDTHHLYYVGGKKFLAMLPRHHANNANAPAAAPSSSSSASSASAASNTPKRKPSAATSPTSSEEKDQPSLKKQKR